MVVIIGNIEKTNYTTFGWNETRSRKLQTIYLIQRLYTKNIYAQPIYNNNACIFKIIEELKHYIEILIDQAFFKVKL